MVPAGLMCHQGHGDVPVLPLLRAMVLLGLSFHVVLCLSGQWLTWVRHHYGDERDTGFRAGEGLQVNGTLSHNFLILPFPVIMITCF